MFGKTEERTDEGASGELALVLLRDMHKRSQSEDAGVGDVGLLLAPRFFWCHAVQSLRGSEVMDTRGVTNSVVPVGFGERGIGQHGPDFVLKRPVHAFGHAIVLRHVQGCHFVPNLLVLQVLLQRAGDVFAPSNGTKGDDAVVRLDFCDCSPPSRAPLSRSCTILKRKDFCALHESFEAIHDFGPKLDPVDENLPERLVVNPGYEVLVVFVGLGQLGHAAANIREDATENDVGSGSSGLVDLRTGLLAL